MLKTDNEKLLLKIKEKGLTIIEVSEKLGINRATFYRRMANNSFRISDIQKLTAILGLSGEEATIIFLAA